MKRIDLLTISPEANGDEPLVYADMLRMVIRQPLDQSKGVSIEEMRQGLRLLDALDAAPADTYVDLEDADYEHLKSKIEAMHWGMVDRRLMRFIDSVLEATSP